MALRRRDGAIETLRVHRRGGGFGPPGDRIDGELVVKLVEFPGEAYGVTLRDDADGPTHRAMFDLLRDALRTGQEVQLEVELDDGKRNGKIVRLTVERPEETPPGQVVSDPFGGLVVAPIQPI